MYIKQVSFNKDERCFKEGETFQFERLTCLVGDQGSGKSTILELLNQRGQGKRNCLDVKLANPEVGIDVFYFDTEKDNPRMKNPISYTTVSGDDKGIGFANALHSKFASHGEIMTNFTVKAIKKAEKCIILLDEPESGLSLRNQYKLCNEINDALNRNCQFIVSTHCLPLIQTTPNVLSLEHRIWMRSEDFIQSQK